MEMISFLAVVVTIRSPAMEEMTVYMEKWAMTLFMEVKVMIIFMAERETIFWVVIMLLNLMTLARNSVMILYMEELAMIFYLAAKEMIISTVVMVWMAL